MDGLFNWIMNSPHNTMITKVVVCEYDGDSISGNLAAGTYLLIGYRRNNYAHLTAYSYWGSRPMSVATIENGAWAKRFEKVITNTDLQNYPKTIQFNIPIGSHVIIKEGDNRFAQLLFLQASNMNGQGIYGLSGYGEGGSRYFVSNISPNDSINIEIIGTTFKITNNFSNIVVATLTKFMGDTPTIQ